MSLFKQERPAKATKVCSVENLNPSKGITSALFHYPSGKYAVCLCLPGMVKHTTFTCKASAKKQMKDNRALYKEL